MAMRELTYQVSFNTPAFLGNAEQQAQWRTPPFKALLRQWWRVVKAPEVGYDHRLLLRQEHALFGSAGENDQGGRSKLQLRLSGWQDGTLAKDNVGQLGWVEHMEVDPRRSAPRQGEKVVRADVYLGYGPIGRSSAIDAGMDPNVLMLRLPAEISPAIAKAMQLVAWFGTLGSRSRNGWGALQIEGEDLLGYDGLSDAELLKYASALPLSEGLRLNWPHGFSQRDDGKLSVWRVGKVNRIERSIDGFESWRQVMEELARIKIGIRTALKFPVEATAHSTFQDRHVLAYPVTNHKVRGIGDEKRLSSSLRFKVHKRGSKYFGVIAHLPASIPGAFMSHPPTIDFQKEVWLTVYQWLDTKFPERVTRIKKGAS